MKEKSGGSILLQKRSWMTTHKKFVHIFPVTRISLALVVAITLRKKPLGGSVMLQKISPYCNTNKA